MFENSSVTKSVPFLFAKISMISSFDPGLFDIIRYSKDDSLLCAFAAIPSSPAPLRRR